MPWRITLMAITAAVACTTATFALAADGMRNLAHTAGIRFGTAVNVEALGTDAAYSKLLAREFDLVTPENAMKFSVIQPERGRFDFTQADALVAFAEAHAMQVNGHVLVWDQQLPDWLTQGHFSSDELKAILREHIQTVVARYRGRVASWDVAAEAVGKTARRARPSGRVASARTIWPWHSAGRTRPTRRRACATTTTAAKAPAPNRTASTRWWPTCACAASRSTPWACKCT